MKGFVKSFSHFPERPGRYFLRFETALTEANLVKRLDRVISNKVHSISPPKTSIFCAKKKMGNIKPPTLCDSS
jgi:hypothetical protein